MKLFIRHLFRKLNHTLGKMIYFILAVRLIPHIIHYLSEEKECNLKEDIKIWKKNYHYVDWNMHEILVFIKIMTLYPEFRNLFYYRAHWQGGFFEYLCPPMDTLFLKANSIGPGLFISHGFSTIVAAQTIGKNFYLHQQVTIGWKGGDCPTIGDNVQIGAGAIVIGGILVGDNSIIGAGATVTKEVNASTIVVGNPAYVIKNSGAA